MTHIHINDILDTSALESLVADGYIGRKAHPSAPLSLYDYAPKTQYERVWTPETLACRGLIVHDDGRIWARPFPKFFNASEHDALPLHEGFAAYDKLDGSLGIAYRHPVTNEWHISTRGSFVSDQALHATGILRAKYADRLDRLATAGQTWLFEIIYPTNRIVVDYGELDDLVLLAIIDHSTGHDQTLPTSDEWPGPIVARHHTLREWSQVAAADDVERPGDEAEGYVVRFDSGLRVKVKFNDYVRLHRVVTGVSTVTVWEHLSEGRSFDELLDRVPDEFFTWLTNLVDQLRSQYRAIESECEEIMRDPRVRPADRKSTAEFFADKPNRAVLFKMFDRKSYEALIWRMLKPDFAKPFKSVEAG
jgi:RNA ligase